MQSLGDVLVIVAQQKRDSLLSDCANGLTDTDLADEEKPTRSEVGPEPGCLLKFGDDVEVDGVVARYLCPGRGTGYFYGYYFDDMGRLTLGSFHTLSVTDRIPADPEETAMPIFPQPEQPPP